jgi:hypothetical protein
MACMAHALGTNKTIKARFRPWFEPFLVRRSHLVRAPAPSGPPSECSPRCVCPPVNTCVLRVSGFGFRVSGFRDSVFVFRVLGFGFRFEVLVLSAYCLGFRAFGSGDLGHSGMRCE